MLIVDEYDLNEFNPEDYVDEISTDALLNELKKRKNVKKSNLVFDKTFSMSSLKSMQKWEFHDFLADFLGKQHTISKEEILEELKYYI